ncbi:MAG: glycosyltransferase family 4 protein [Oscillospiraceae bacterium]
MKILITTDWYSPVINGVVTSVSNLRKELLLLGHDVRVLTLSRTTHSFTKDGVAYIGSIGAGKIYPGARLKTSFTNSYVQEITRWKPDIIHSQCEFSTFFIARRIAKKLDIPIVHTYHTVYEDYTHYFSPNQKWGRHMAESYSRWVLKQTACVIAPTDKVRTILSEYGVGRDIRVIPTGIDLRKFTMETDPEKLLDLKRGLGIPAENRVLIYVGRLAKEKNLEEILTLHAKMRQENVTLLIVGDGPHRSSLEHTSEQLGIGSKVVFTGMIPPDSVADYYRLGDLFVSASGSETQGLTYIEALASGIPALCRKDPCLDNVIVNGKNGWQYEDESDYFEKLALYLSSSDVRASMSYYAAQMSDQQYSAAAFAKKAESTYNDMLEIAAGPPAACRLNSVNAAQ